MLAAGGSSSSPDARTALASLCEVYWYPLYAFARRRGYQSHDATDLTQSFFARMLEKDYLRAADQNKGRFRSFLLTMFKRFLSKEADRDGSLKRGGGHTIVSFDAGAAEARYQREPADQQTPERVFERRWAITLLDRVLHSLQQEYEAKNRSALFEACRVYLTGTTAAPSHAETARSLNMSPGAVKVSVHRLRERYRELLQQQVAETVESDGDVGDELRILLAAVQPA